MIQKKDINITPIPIFSDNYAWLISFDNQHIVVDPGQASPVENILKDKRLSAILITHYHADHMGGASQLAQKYKCPIYGAMNIHPTHILKGGEKITIDHLKIDVIATPGHVHGHLSYYSPQAQALFTGDTLFSMGCGRLFEGTAKEMFDSMQTYKKLPRQTMVYPGHEYTESNLSFVENLPRNESHINEDIFEKRKKDVIQLRQEGKPTVPVSLEVECETNPFLLAKTVKEFAELRHKKDQA